jgi:hypothetical protein
MKERLMKWIRFVYNSYYDTLFLRFLRMLLILIYIIIIIIIIIIIDF